MRLSKGAPGANRKTPRDFLTGLSRGGGWLALLADRVPATLEELEAAGVPAEILEELRALVLEGFPPKAVVGAFLAALSVLATESGCSRQFTRRLRNRLPKSPEGEALERRVAALLAGMTADEWS